MILFDSTGRKIETSTKIASGGEGTVFSIVGNSNLVAKLYTAPPSRNRIDKLKSMVARSSPELYDYSAWPIDVLADRPNGNVLGFLMHFIRDHREVHDLYSPKYRALHFEQAHWGFLVLAAENMCKAFHAVHKQGHVVGDVNNTSVLVSPKATAKIIDCDSFQLTLSGSKYTCDVGVPIYTPPELQGASFDGLLRTQNHDAFGIAVLVFQLLFMGRHPFSGDHVGKGDMELTQKIRECRFAFGPGAATRGMRQPPGTPSLDVASIPVALLFENAFSVAARSGGRPSAVEWVEALSRLRGTLRCCPRQSVHWFYQGLAACPWCDIERTTSVSMFAVRVSPNASLRIAIDIDWCWNEIEAVPAISFAQEISVGHVRASDPLAVRAGRIRRSRPLTVFLSILLLISILSTADVISGAAPFVLGLVGVVVAACVSQERNAALHGQFQQELREAEVILREAQANWDSLTSSKRVSAKYSELERYKNELPTLSREREQRMAKLVATTRETQLRRYLDQFRIDRASIPGIGPVRTADLEAAGIRTAADIDQLNRVWNVYGIGWTYANKLVDWRKSKETRFVFDPTKGVDPADVRALDSELQRRKQRAESELKDGAATLLAISKSILAARSQLRPALENAMKRFEAAKANVRAL